MQIYKDYTTLNLLFNEPCNIDDKCTIYPISVKDYERFMGYTKYLLLSKQQLMLGEKDNLLQTIILISVAEKNKGSLNLIDPQTIETMNIVLEDLCKMFSIITKEKIECKSSNDGGFCFVGKTTLINSNNYDNIREVIMKMTLLKEPKVFKNKEVEKWYYKAIKASQRGKKGIDLDDIISIVIQDMKYTFEYVYSLNVFQLYVLYARINNSVSYETISKFRCVGDVKVKLEYNDGVISNLYKDTELGDMLMSESELNGMI